MTSALPCGSLDLLLTYFHSLEDLISDDSITEIMVNPDGHVWFERAGRICASDKTVSRTESQMAADHVARRMGRELDESDPALSAALEDGSRISIIVPPASSGVSVAIRKFPSRRMNIGELIAAGGLTADQVEILGSALVARRNVVLAGAAGSGKTTVLAALAAEFIPLTERVVIIEQEAHEIVLPHPNQVSLVAGPHASTSRLLFEGLRQRIQRVIFGEARGDEAYDLLQAMNTGHSGTITTLHANSAVDALYRVSDMACAAKPNLNPRMVRMQVARTLEFIGYLTQGSDGKRRMVELIHVTGYEPETDVFKYRTAISGCMV